MVDKSLPVKSAKGRAAAAKCFGMPIAALGMIDDDWSEKMVNFELKPLIALPMQYGS